jgi:ribonuclease P protein component
MGVIVPRFGATAVARNRLRRRLRELLRRRVVRRAGATDLVARVRADAYRATSADLADDLQRWPPT